MFRLICLVCATLLAQLAHAQPNLSMKELADISFNKTIKYYPKLKNININIKVKDKGSAMSASYSWWSVFRKASKRKYFVKMNQHVKGAYMCYQFDHLNSYSRDGVMGHELAHIDFFNSLNFFGFVKFIFQQALPGGLKKSERATDVRTIEHGLGNVLKEWSRETRFLFLESEGNNIPKKFATRYLTPAEIDSVMKLFPDLY